MQELNLPDSEILKEIVTVRMPYGKFCGVLMSRLPIEYLEWFKRQGLPPNKLGVMLDTVYEIKLNGLDSLLRELERQVHGDIDLSWNGY